MYSVIDNLHEEFAGHKETLIDINETIIENVYIIFFFLGGMVLRPFGGEMFLMFFQPDFCFLFFLVEMVCQLLVVKMFV